MSCAAAKSGMHTTAAAAAAGKAAEEVCITCILFSEALAGVGCTQRELHCCLYNAGAKI